MMPYTKDLAVLYYDTEQSEAQLYKNLDKTLRRTSLTSFPNFYHSLYLVSLSKGQTLIRESMDLFHHKHEGIHLVVIDGIALLFAPLMMKQRLSPLSMNSTAWQASTTRVLSVYFTLCRMVST